MIKSIWLQPMVISCISLCIGVCSLNFNTQFAKGYDYSNEDASFISKFMAPAYIVVGTGLTWTPKSYFTATLTPVSWRGTVVADSRLSDEGAFGVKEGKASFIGIRC